MLLDGFLDLFDRHEWQLTDVIEAAIAEEVPVDGAVPVGGVLDDHAATLTTTAVARATEQRPLQLVVMHTSVLAGAVASVGNHLDLVEEVW
ncbi:hypothetical protein [Streptomyces sp. MBT53]|uniref:hypothetical protein n=1 Tax=Streptomyces sp. MBT53 TaxID=1488384 RepID=UPI00191299C4|nr:hypothetical protein [Streptomyces sp. MBT53]MBK6017002.1 hypothetical protein [Streptomyces sp. MBT53]